MMNTADVSLLPLGMSDFAALRMSGQVYVDKTALVYEMASMSKFSLFRPRRFGKSLLVSTFESLFKHGLRDFRGLAIESLWKDEGQYLVVRLDFSEIRNFTSIGEFRQRLCALLARGFGEAGFSYAPGGRFTVYDQLAIWLEDLPICTLVLLIDECDAPLAACLGNAELFEEVAWELSNFYDLIKSEDRAIRFFFLTGIMNFSLSNIFSGLNNLTDISLMAHFGTLLGFTRDEVESCFGAWLGKAAEVQKMPRGELIEKLEEQYGGYCFSKDPAQKVFAPWPVLKFLSYPASGFGNYWFESGGSPIRHLEPHSLRHPGSFAAEKSITLSELNCGSDARTLSDIELLTRAGYLTIRKIVGTTAYLDYPNAEVRTSMARLYTGLLLKGKTAEQAGAENAESRLAGASPEEVFELFNRFFGSLDDQNYPVRDEASVCAFVQVLLAGAGLDPKADVHYGRVGSGLAARAGNRLWLFEFRVARAGESAEAGLSEAAGQLKAKECGLQQGGLELIRMALVFSQEERQFVQWAEVP